jgi:hypothetical protein
MGGGGGKGGGRTVGNTSYEVRGRLLTLGEDYCIMIATVIATFIRPMIIRAMMMISLTAFIRMAHYGVGRVESTLGR